MNLSSWKVHTMDLTIHATGLEVPTQWHVSCFWRFLMGGSSARSLFPQFIYFLYFSVDD